MSPWVEPFKTLRLLPWTISYEVHKIKIYTKYQRPWLPKVLNKKIPPMYVFVKQVSSGAGLFYFSLRAIIWTILVEALKMKLHTNYKRPRPSSFREDFLKFFFPYMCLCKTSDPWVGAIFDPILIIWIVLEVVDKLKIHNKYQRLRPSSFIQENCFKFFVDSSLCNRIRLFHKNGQDRPKGIFFSSLIRPMSPMFHYKPHGYWRAGYGEDFKGFFYRIWAWWPP